MKRRPHHAVWPPFVIELSQGDLGTILCLVGDGLGTLAR
jgi:hypothetical protein